MRTETPEQRPVHSERTWAHPWMWILLWGACLTAFLMTAVMVSELTRDGAASASGAQAEIFTVTALVTLVLPAAISAILGRLEVDVWRDRIEVAFGPVRLFRREIAFDHIRRVDAVTIRPIRDFGGWGIRFRGRRTAWTISGNRAVRLDLSDGREIFVGSRYPHRLAERIQGAMRAHERSTEN